jgi:Uma2 family endonuclease
MSAAAPETRKLTVLEFLTLIEDGFFGPRHVELLEGCVVNRKRHSPLSAAIASIIDRWFIKRTSTEISSRVRTLVEFSESCPQPDHAIVRGTIQQYADRFPNGSEILVVVEVSGSTLQSDREVKGRIYAKEGVQEYWIVNCEERQIEVYTDPSTTGKSPRYRKLTTYLPGQTLPVHVASKKLGDLGVNDLFPPKK